MPTEITLYGYGFVGRAVFNFLKDHYSVQVINPGVIDDLDGYLNSPDDIAFEKTKYAVICVPTPMSEDGSCDTSIVEEILLRGDHEYYLIKSTVVPGTTERLIAATGKKIAFSPELIGEGKYEIPYWLDLPHPTNMKLHSFHIFGGDKETTGVWVNMWQKIAGWTPRYMQTDSTTAELVKYSINSYLATKKVFCDELYELAKTFGVDYNELKELWLLDGRIGRSMTMIFPDKRGFGGKCLPKDVNGIVKAAEKKGYNATLLKEVLASNERVKGYEV